VTTNLLAAYGTLRQPGVRRRLAVEDRLQPRGPCLIPGRLYDLGAYPALVPDATGSAAGELLEVADDSVLAMLDHYEGYVPDAPDASLFRRELLTLRQPTVTAWVYVYPHPGPPEALVASGDWLRLP
jgi:gamma-glutamylcyclotransferase (GGCT)/AIG2-like uncharacterized protein YtfP